MYLGDVTSFAARHRTERKTFLSVAAVRCSVRFTHIYQATEYSGWMEIYMHRNFPFVWYVPVDPVGTNFIPPVMSAENCWWNLFSIPWMDHNDIVARWVQMRHSCCFGWRHQYVIWTSQTLWTENGNAANERYPPRNARRLNSIQESWNILNLHRLFQAWNNKYGGVFIMTFRGRLIYIMWKRRMFTLCQNLHKTL